MSSRCSSASVFLDGKFLLTLCLSSLFTLRVLKLAGKTKDETLKIRVFYHRVNRGAALTPRSN
ncbi:MAG: hypothetical protein ACJASG_001925 [Oleiphilaceae bacterium]|jgi:hypothetical protein